MQLQYVENANLYLAQLKVATGLSVLPPELLIKIFFDEGGLAGIEKRITSRYRLDRYEAICHCFRSMVNTLLYRHVNLRNEEVELAFLQRVLSSDLQMLSDTRTLQFKIPAGTIDVSSPPPVKAVISKMKNLHALNVLYYHADNSTLDKVIFLMDKMKSNVETLHLRPVEQETFLSVSLQSHRDHLEIYGLRAVAG